MVIIFSLIAVAFTLSGAGAALRFGDIGKSVLSRALAYAAGVLVSVALLDILPEGLRLNAAALSWGALGALFAMFALETFAAHSASNEVLGECEVHEHDMGPAAFAAMGLHSLLDGFNIAVGFAPGAVIGVNVALGVVLHKFADGVTLVTLLLHAGRKPREALLYALALAAATPAGALISSLAISGTPPGAEAFVLGLSSGSFLYIAMADILPRLHRVSDRFSPLVFPLGFATVALIRRLGE